jgi:energy-coupling factor transporter ATP-binding protein EcfA2
MRLLDKKGFEFTLANLGFENDMLQIFRKWITMPYGMIIVSGPTGSGKSTTLHAALKTVQNEEDNIVTVEDPVEYQIDKINQVATNDSIGLSAPHPGGPGQDLMARCDKETDIAIKFAHRHLVHHLHANDAPRRSPACSTSACPACGSSQPGHGPTPGADHHACGRVLGGRRLRALKMDSTNTGMPSLQRPGVRPMPQYRDVRPTALSSWR